MVPEFLLGRAVDVGDPEVDCLVHQLALLPGDWLTALLASPHLIPLLVSLPEGDAVLFGHVATLRNLLDVRHSLGRCLACLLYKQLGRQLSLGVLLLLHPHGAL